MIVSPYEEVIKKDSDKSEAIDEQAELEPAHEPLPDTEKVQDEKLNEQSDTEEKDPKESSKGKKKTAAKKTKGKNREAQWFH